MLEQHWKNNRDGIIKLKYDLEKISSQIARKNAIKKLFKKIFSAILIIIAIINLIFLIYKVKGEEALNFLGLRFFNIVSRKYATTAKYKWCNCCKEMWY